MTCDVRTTYEERRDDAPDLILRLVDVVVAATDVMPIDHAAVADDRNVERVPLVTLAVLGRWRNTVKSGTLRPTSASEPAVTSRGWGTVSGRSLVVHQSRIFSSRMARRRLLRRQEKAHD